MLRLLCILLLFVLFCVCTSHNNDDFCDTQGDDERATGACSGTAGQHDFFSCANAELGERFPQSRVNDGVCDCCDGSDEELTKRQGRTSCPDTCFDQVRALREDQERKSAVQRAGRAKKTAVLESSNKALQDMRQNHNSAHILIPDYERQLDSLREELTREDKNEGEELEHRVADASVAFDKAVATLFPENSMTRETKMHLIAALTLRGKEDTAEAVLAASAGKYVMDGPDADDTEAIVLAMDSPSDTDNGQSEGSTDAGVPQSLETLDAMASALALVRLEDDVHDNLLKIALGYALSKNVMRLALRDAGLLFSITSAPDRSAALDALPQPPQQVRAAGYASEVAVELRSKIKELEARLQRIRDGSSDSQKILRMDFGKLDELFALYEQRKCFSYNDRQYSYTLCPYGDARQRGTHLGAHDGTVVYSRTDPNVPEMLLFHAGERCMGTSDRRERTLKLFLECGDAETDYGFVSALQEIEVCVYQATLVTPLVC